jgi:hypothetical protein
VLDENGTELRRLIKYLENGKDVTKLYLSRMETDGLVSILLLKREFHMELTFEDIRPATQSAD